MENNLHQMAIKTITDAQYLAAIRGKIEDRDWALKLFFSNNVLFNLVIRHVVRHGGSWQDGEDVFQDAIILFDRSIREDIFKGQSNLTTYFVGIAKWRWVSNKRKDAERWNLALGDKVCYSTNDHRPTTNNLDIQSPISNPEVRFIENERRQVIDEVLTLLGCRCKQLLRLYQLSYSMQEIADMMELSSAAMAKKNCCECRKKFKEFITKRPEYETILNIPCKAGKNKPHD
jgi:RNA polymerase sigma factor (sigma-70 family)